jgi:hypothetical protein
MLSRLPVRQAQTCILPVHSQQVLIHPADGMDALGI